MPKPALLPLLFEGDFDDEEVDWVLGAGSPG